MMSRLQQFLKTEISAFAFYDRFTDIEKMAVQTLAMTNPEVALGITHAQLRGTVTLTGATVGAWMDALVAAGAITADRRAEIMTV